MFTVLLLLKKKLTSYSHHMTYENWTTFTFPPRSMLYCFCMKITKAEHSTGSVNNSGENVQYSF